ncbi:class I adenylate-forming enzyme family protein [Halobellus ordinarius]|uniref:class I adenylate-forming enzyme family protein n=1 Tax=Halobellus ordinarius TaxID=3075120 RepID=UPI00288032F3|nr:AMP-binding protein [Halobellus sp. ZY16]
MRDWLSHRARIDPDDEALIEAETGDIYRFSDLDALVDDVAGRLASLGVERGDHLGAVLQPSLEYVCLLHAAMRLGVTIVPMGAGLTARELAGKIATADVTIVLCDASTEGSVVDAVARVADGTGADIGAGSDTKAPSTDGGADRDGEAADPPAVVSVDDPQGDCTEPLSAATPEQVTVADLSLSDTQLIVYTSGTTGDPKPVRLTVKNVLASAVTSAFRLGLDPADRWLATLPLHHVGGITPLLRMPLYGMTVVLRGSFEAGSAADDLDRYDATAVSLVPTMLRRMLDKRGTLTDSLRIVLLGGAPVSTELIERCRDYGVPVHPTYGMTETASQAATATPKEAFADPESVGRPLLFTEMTVVDGSGVPLPRGESGELVVDGPTVTPGYYGNEPAAAESFGEFGLHTGDVAVVDESGTLNVLNRVDDRIITGGEIVDPGEVSNVLVSHPAVRDAVVVGVPDAEWGERVAALVVPDNGVGSGTSDGGSPADASIDRSELLEYSRELLAGFKLPKTIAFTDELPRTVSGTADRQAVRKNLSYSSSESSAPDRSDSI